MTMLPDRADAFRIARYSENDKDKDKRDALPTLPKPPRPEADSSSLATVSQTSASTPYPTVAPIQAAPSSGKHFGPAGSAGIGIGVTIAVLILILGAWFVARRRRLGKMRKVSFGSKLPDTEAGGKGIDPGSTEYHPPGVKELEAGRRASELATHRDPVEVAGDPGFVAELQGSNIPMAGWSKPDRERLFPDSPIDEPDNFDEVRFGKTGSEKRSADDPEKSDLSEIDRKKHDF